MKAKRLVKALTIAGSDSGGGAGIQADLKTFAAAGIYGSSVITAITAQNTEEVRRSFFLPADLVSIQIDAVMEDIAPTAVKTGMLGNAEIITAVCRKADEYGLEKLVVDPVMVSTSGDRLLEEEAVTVLKEKLLPRALILTPTLAEASVLARFAVTDSGSILRAGRRILEMGCRSVVIKGGHRRNDADDYFFDDTGYRVFSSPRLTERPLHGTGCTFSAAVTAAVAAGLSPAAAVEAAKGFMVRALRSPLQPGRGARVANWPLGGSL